MSKPNEKTNWEFDRKYGVAISTGILLVIAMFLLLLGTCNINTAEFEVEQSNVEAKTREIMQAIRHHSLIIRDEGGLTERILTILETENPDATR